MTVFAPGKALGQRHTLRAKHRNIFSLCIFWSLTCPKKSKFMDTWKLLSRAVTSLLPLLFIFFFSFFYFKYYSNFFIFYFLFFNWFLFTRDQTYALLLDAWQFSNLKKIILILKYNIKNFNKMKIQQMLSVGCNGKTQKKIIFINQRQ